MGKYWREKLDIRKHRDHMSYYEGNCAIKKPKDNLVISWVYFIEVQGFVMEFISIDQVKQAREYFSVKAHQSTREYHNGIEHSWQPWYCRLPKGLNKEVNRQRIIKLLDLVILKWG